jgi:Protein of unknown function (DUF2786)
MNNADRLISEALIAARAKNSREFGRLLDALESLALTAPQELLPLLTNRLTSCLSFLWAGGWQPLDALHVLGRRTSGAHHGVLLDAIVTQHAHLDPTRIDPRWADQLARINVIRDATEKSVLFAEHTTARPVQRLLADVRFAIDLLAVLVLLPKLERLLPPPGEAFASARTTTRPTNATDNKVLTRVRGLLAKAESTTFAEEAEALTAKAQELMARHAIDLAMLDASAPVHGQPEARRVHLDDPYVDAKSSLLSAVARENRCSAVFSPGFGFSTVFGFESDLDFVELLFTSLLTQATSSMVTADRQVDRAGRSRTRSFRQSFLISFAHRIAERLHEANEAAAQQAQADLGDAFLPVLATRAAQVENLVESTFTNLRSRKVTISNEAGWHAGREAADNATLRPPGVLPRTRR